jgi:hypothetical protein
MMKTAMETSWTDNYFRWLNEQEHDRNRYRLPALTPQNAGITDAQQVMLLPFEMMRQYMEDVMLQQLEIATGLCEKQTEEFENAFMTYVDRKHR